MRRMLRLGAFRTLRGFGADPAGITPEGICALVKQTGDADTYGKCLSWNRAMTADLQAHPDRSQQYVAAATQADQACAKLSAAGDMIAFQKCYYDALVKEPWYTNPYYLAGAIAGGAAALALLVAKYRGSLGQ